MKACSEDMHVKQLVLPVERTHFVVVRIIRINNLQSFQRKGAMTKPTKIKRKFNSFSHLAEKLSECSETFMISEKRFVSIYSHFLLSCYE